ncbi:isoaspartyl dipeptidase [Pontibacillus chungwhensis BH030062]|uniref:Isoaspartyl dipeptidase n=1 Tax=Pontibacillus chungwhensis BH030062 TaxID=1385513 RepID=A0A0A2UWS6_9BACI|nr:beta-aspartyl-peptidase [Pontibacillus chungwhensis]KGP91218.1 isoaspartyl dipeptidase [Pontibacillus chungwhensis BH030062]
MLRLLKHAHVYTPQSIGKKDILLAGGKIIEIKDSIDVTGVDVEVLDRSNAIVMPGLVDRHVHITGGGGEGGFASSTPEVQLSHVVESGITTVVGLLGTNDVGRTPKSLLAKAKALREEGLNAYMLTGGYGYPSNTITGEVREDLLFIEEILGLKLAIEDHRSSYVTTEELKRLASYIRVSSMLAKKKGFIHLHMGSGKGHYEQLYQILEETDLPIGLFSPTHVNRTFDLLEASVEFANRGGLVDITSNVGMKGNSKSLTPAESLLYLLNQGVSINQITVSSDANGSLPVFDEGGQLTGMKVAGFEPTLEALRFLIRDESISVEDAIKPFTTNPAQGLGLGQRGLIEEGSYADLLVLNEEDLSISDVMINGVSFVHQGDTVRKGTFE